MNQYEILDEALDYLNEGKILNKLKGIINNIINKNLKNDKYNMNNKNPKSVENVTFSLTKVSSKSEFDKLYNKEVYCAEGLAQCNEDSTAEIFKNVFANYDDFSGNKINFYYCYGKDLNSAYHLTDDNKYPADLGIFFIDWSTFGSKFDAAKHKGKFRYFSDVVDNNARREIRKGNDFYKDYHSLYGDDWFYSTVEKL